MDFVERFNLNRRAEERRREAWWGDDLGLLRLRTKVAGRLFREAVDGR